ncbi:MAG: hypothetical protein LPK27_19040 [Rhodococcus sp. (in: high G+C Gram-positive bacteria)]|nr:hypothetical protein [Rhodococcus sp. (in: high G+C Gram-positive bacteria)]
MAKRPGQRWRQATVWLHVVTSVGWMSQALALLVLLTLSRTAVDPAVRVAGTTMAQHLDSTLLAPLANASAFTGFLLAAATPWGFLRYWWVAIKFVLTVVQVNLGIFLLSAGLNSSVDAARDGASGPAGPMIAGTALMVGALAFQAWLSVAKPWARTPWTAGKAKLPTAPPWVFTMATGAVAADLAVALLLGHPLPAFSAVALVVASTTRARTIREASLRPAYG